jgi:hypothetical protein
MGTVFTTALAAAVLLLAVARAVEQLWRLQRAQEKAIDRKGLRASPLAACAGAASLAYAYQIDGSVVLMAAASLGTGTSFFIWLYPHRIRAAPRSQPAVNLGERHE